MLTGGNENQTVRKKVVVLGGESKFKQKGQIENDSSNKKPRPLFNHCMIHMCTYMLYLEDGFETYHINTIYIFFF